MSEQTKEALERVRDLSAVWPMPLVSQIHEIACDGLATVTAPGEDSVAVAKARLVIATLKARNRGGERAKVEVYADDIAVLLAAHADLDRIASAGPSTVEAALRAQEDAEDARSACVNCEGEGMWEHCPSCSLTFGRAIDLRRAVLAGKAPKGEQPKLWVVSQWKAAKSATPPPA